MKKFELLLSNAKPMKGNMNDWNYQNLKNMLPKNMPAKEYDKQLKRICDKITLKQ